MFNKLKSDFPASVVVFFVAIPLCLGIALASGAPLFSGLIAGIVGGIIVGALSGSSLGVSGPAAGLTAIVLAGITALGGYENLLVAIVLALEHVLANRFYGRSENPDPAGSRVAGRLGAT